MFRLGTTAVLAWLTQQHCCLVCLAYCLCSAAQIHVPQCEASLTVRLSVTVYTLFYCILLTMLCKTARLGPIIPRAGDILWQAPAGGLWDSGGSKSPVLWAMCALQCMKPQVGRRGANGLVLADQKQDKLNQTKLNYEKLGENTLTQNKTENIPEN